MSFKDILESSVRFFVFQSKDMATLPELQAGYPAAILIDKLGMNPNLVRIESCYPYKKYYDELSLNFNLFPEECYVFFLENFYHSSAYAIKEVEYILSRLDLNKKVYIHTSKMNSVDAIALAEKYRSIQVICMTDIEYVMTQELCNNVPICDIENVIYREGDEVKTTVSGKVEYPLEDFILPAYTNGKLLREKDSVSRIAEFVEEDNQYTDINSYYNKPRCVQVENLYRQEYLKTAMICSGRGCKYKCSYCFRGVKYSKIRQIPLDVVEKDLSYLKHAGIRRIYFYDDCFITTNRDRLPEIASLMRQYSCFEYYIAIRYEACTPDILDQLSDIKFYNVQIGLQSTKHNSSHKRTFNHEKLVSAIDKFKKFGSFISIDLILGLPGEGPDDFKESLRYAASLLPQGIIINTLFINPGTELANTYQSFGIKTRTVAMNVPYIVSSDTFSEEDLTECRRFVGDMIKMYPDVTIGLR